MLLAGCVPTSPPRGIGPIRSPAGRPGEAAPIKRIVIDAGHGGHDPGTSHYGLKEKYLALDIAKRLRTHLKEAGLTVVMTRETDRFVPLSERSAIANRLPADLFVSIHINANRNRRISGIEVYYPRVSVVSASAPWPPLVGPSEIGVPSATVKQILWDLTLRHTRARSRRLAQAICRTMKERLQAPCRGVKAARFVVLREAWMPSVLVETGYVSNQTEATRLGNAEYREAAAHGIAKGIVSFIESAR